MTTLIWMTNRPLFQALILIGVIATAAPAGPPAAKEGGPPQSIEDLPPEVQMKYQELRQRLELANVGYQKAYRESKIADPSLRFAYRLVMQSRNHLSSPLSRFERQYKEQGAATYEKFCRWQEYYSRHYFVDRLREMPVDDHERISTVWTLRYSLQVSYDQPETGSMVDIKILLPNSPSQLSDDEVINAWIAIYEQNLSKNRPSPIEFQELEKDIAPSEQLKKIVRRKAISEFQCSVAEGYIAAKTPKSVEEAERSCKDISHELYVIWPDWWRYEKEVRNNKRPDINVQIMLGWTAIATVKMFL